MEGTEKNIDATVIFREKILDEFQPLREGFKQESVKKIEWVVTKLSHVSLMSELQSTFSTSVYQIESKLYSF